MEAALLEVAPVEVGDLQLAARRGLELGGVLDDVVVVEVEPRHREVALRVLRLLLQRQRAALGVELHHAVGPRVGDVVAEDGGAVELGEAQQLLAEAGAVEDVVAQHERGALVADVVGADDERLREAVGAGLHREGQVDAELRAVAEQAVEAVRLVRRGDDQHVADAGEHQRGERVVDHRLVVDRDQLLADALGDRVQSRAGPTGQDDSTHGPTLLWARRGVPYGTM